MKGRKSAAAIDKYATPERLALALKVLNISRGAAAKAIGVSPSNLTLVLQGKGKSQPTLNKLWTTLRIGFEIDTGPDLKKYEQHTRALVALQGERI